MKKIVIATSLFINALLVSCFLHQRITSTMHQEIKKSGKILKIAILTPTTHPALEAIEYGFRETLNIKGKNSYDMVTFNANGNKMLMQAQAQEIVQGSYDLVFTIATQPSQLIKELCVKKHKTMPIVFGAADQPERLGLVKSLQVPGGHVTGVVEIPHLPEQIALLQAIKPSLKKVLLVYNPTQGGGREIQKQELEKIFTSKGIELISVEVYNTNEIYAKVQALISGIDVVMVLKDNTVVSGIDGLIKLCNMHHVTLFASDLDSGDKGAALSYGVHEDQFGVQGAHLALKILEEGASPANLSCVDAGQHKFKINTKVMKQQALVIPDEQLQLLTLIEVI